jgi:hypothetical protein
MMKISQKPSEVVEVPVELWTIMKTWPDAMNRCKTASAGLLFTLKEMEDILRAEELILKVKKSE